MYVQKCSGSATSSEYSGDSKPGGEKENATLVGMRKGVDDGKQEKLGCVASANDLKSLASASCGNCVVGDSPFNRFRSNVEIIEKPRQMIVLFATIGVASYWVS